MLPLPGAAIEAWHRQKQNRASCETKLSRRCLMDVVGSVRLEIENEWPTLASPKLQAGLVWDNSKNRWHLPQLF